MLRKFVLLYKRIDYMEIYLSVKLPSEEIIRKVFMLFYWFFSKASFLLILLSYKINTVSI